MNQIVAARLHAIDATPARWRRCRFLVHPTHWLISAQNVTISFLPNMRSQILLKACARGARRAWLAVVPTDEAKLSRREDLVGWSIDREAERHSIPKTPNFADFSSTGAARLPHLPASGVGLVEGNPAGVSLDDHHGGRS